MKDLIMTLAVACLILITGCDYRSAIIISDEEIAIADDPEPEPEPEPYVRIIKPQEGEVLGSGIVNILTETFDPRGQMDSAYCSVDFRSRDSWTSFDGGVCHNYPYEYTFQFMGSGSWYLRFRVEVFCDSDNDGDGLKDMVAADTVGVVFKF